MPLEVKELHIKVAVNPPDASGGAQAGRNTATQDQAAGGAGQEEIIAACIEQILEILQERREA